MTGTQNHHCQQTKALQEGLRLLKANLVKCVIHMSHPFSGVQEFFSNIRTVIDFILEWGWLCHNLMDSKVSLHFYMVLKVQEYMKTSVFFFLVPPFFLIKASLPVYQIIKNELLRYVCHYCTFKVIMACWFFDVVHKHVS